MKRTLKKLICLLFVTVLFLNAGCSNKQSESSKMSNSNELDMKSKHNIVFLDKYVEDYINKFEDGAMNNEELLLETVFNPILQEYSVEFKGLLPKTIEDITELKKELSNLKKKRANIEKIIDDSLSKCNEVLPTSKDFSVYILLEDPKVFKKYNVPVRAVTPISGVMLLVLNPIAADFTTPLSHTVAHEYHHGSIDMKKFKKENLVTQLMSEGKAENFAHILFPNVKSKLASKLNEREEYTIWNEIKDSLLNEDENYISEILNGTKDGLPLLSGYRLSYKIVYEFLDKNPKVTVKEWTDMAAENILEKSGYLERWK